MLKIKTSDVITITQCILTRVVSKLDISQWNMSVFVQRISRHTVNVNYVFLFPAESDYIATSDADQEIVWLSSLLVEALLQ